MNESEPVPSSYHSERTRIEAAADRLLRGAPIRSTGELTVVQLAAEAGVKRWILTHRHTDLTHNFQAAVKQFSSESPLIARWKTRVDKLEEELNKVRKDNAELQELNTAYARAIHNLDAILQSRQPSAPVPLRRNRL